MKATQSALLPVSGSITACSTILFLVLAGFPGMCGVAHAVNCISFSNGVDPPFVVCDGDPNDDNGLADEISVDFTLADGVNNDWVASGTILATTTNPAGATLVVTDTRIQNITGNQIIAAQIIVTHDFPPFVSLTQQYTAHIDGAFDRVGGGLLGTLSLAYSASMTGSALGGDFFMASAVQAPVPFNWTGLPFHQDTIIQQRQEFVFYIDELDNTIDLYNSATILPNVTVGVEKSPWGGIKQLYR